jgi:hypothetical protein
MPACLQGNTNKMITYRHLFGAFIYIPSAGAQLFVRISSCFIGHFPQAMKHDLMQIKHYNQTFLYISA